MVYTKATWNDAHAACEAMGMKMAFPQNALENGAIQAAWVLGASITDYVSGYWLGITDVEHEGVMRNANGNIIKYDNRVGSSGGITVNCIYSFVGGIWAEANCAEERHYVCEKERM